MKFFAELKQRRIFQVVVSYGAGAVVALEITDQLVNRQILPPIVYNVLLIWVVAGFGAALIIGWFHGEKGAQSVTALEIALLGLVGGLTLGVSGFTVSRAFAVEEVAHALDPRRVAVLYFEDLSSDRTHQYFADGLTEELIQELTQVRTLDVVSRNGTAQFRDSDLRRDSIARLLDAGTLVDGSIEAVGARVRINLRVVDGLSGAEIRRIAFEPSSSDLLAARDSVVQSVGTALREVVGEEIRLRRIADGRDLQAWTLLQRGERLRKDAELTARADTEAALQLYEQADALLAQAEQVDARWAEPAVVRAAIAQSRARIMAARDRRNAVPYLEAGIAHADRALQLERGNARALDERGRLGYLYHLLNVAPDPARQSALLNEAQADLEQAVQLDRTLASAHSALSHLYHRAGNMSLAVISAQRAYDEDAYLEAAQEILWRLFNTTLELGNFTMARRWCDEGARRFTADDRFAFCQLQLLVTPAVDPDVERGWQLVEVVDSLSPLAARPHRRARSGFIMGGVLARAGMADSARAVLHRTRASVTHEIDPNQELLWREAYSRLLLGEKDEAVALLSRAMAGSPFEVDGESDISWWWRELLSHPQFRAIMQLR